MKNISGCTECNISDVAIRLDDPANGMHAFDGPPLKGNNSLGCDTYTFSCSGISAHIEVSNQISPFLFLETRTSHFYVDQNWLQIYSDIIWTIQLNGGNFAVGNSASGMQQTVSNSFSVNSSNILK